MTTPPSSPHARRATGGAPVGRPMELAEAVCAIAELSMVKDRLRGMMAFLLMLALLIAGAGVWRAHAPTGEAAKIVQTRR